MGFRCLVRVWQYHVGGYCTVWYGTVQRGERECVCVSGLMLNWSIYSLQCTQVLRTHHPQPAQNTQKAANHSHSPPTTPRS